MSRDFANHKIGLASELPVDLIAGADTTVLSFPAHADDEGLRIKPVKTMIGEYAVAFDVFFPSTSAAYISLMQTGSGDGELFLKNNGDGTAGIGISGSYKGNVAFDAWNRIAVTVQKTDSGTVLTSYVNGEEVQSQSLGDTSRWDIGENGLLLFSDNDGETAPGYVSSVFFMNDPDFSAVGAAIAAAPVPDANGFFPQAPASSATEVNFTGNDITPRYGSAAVVLEGENLRSVATSGESRFGLASQLGVDGPGADIPVLQHGAYGPDEAVAVKITGLDTPLSSYTMVWDVNLQELPSGYHSLFQTDTANGNDGELFVRSDGGLGINGSYEGKVPEDTWARIAITVESDGGKATLTKYIDGQQVGTQTVDPARFSINPDKGFLLLGDNNAEVGKGYLAHFALSSQVLDGAAIAALGGVDAQGPLGGDGTLVKIGFDDYGVTVETGAAQAGLLSEQSSAVQPDVTGIKDMLVAVGDTPQTFDLTDVFGDGAEDFQVTTSNGGSVNASIEDGVLTLSYGGLGVSDLVITAQVDGTTVTDNVRVRVAGEGAYTIAILPDTQDYADRNAGAGEQSTFNDIANWLIDNASGKKLGFVTHVGDITQHAGSSEFVIAKEAMNMLREAGIPFSVLPGNHDIGDGGSSNVRKTGTYNDAFSTSYMSQDPTFGGVYDHEPERYDNNYHLWDAPDGTGWLILNLEFGPRDDVLRWADDVLTKYGDRKAMVLTHSYNNFDGRHDPLGGALNGEGAGYNYGLKADPEGTWDAEYLWREVLTKHPNVVFTAGGHIFGDGAETVVSYNDFGNSVYQFLVNYQDGVSTEITGAGNQNNGGNGGNGAIRLVTVDPANNAFYTETYLTELDTYVSGARGSGEMSRDGLQGKYVGHEETYTGVDLGVRSAEAVADAGSDQHVTAQAGEDTVEVSLSAAKTSNPNSETLTFRWLNDEGKVVATGETASLKLSAGVNDFTLEVESGDGTISRADHRVIVETEKTYLVDTFDDGNADGWVAPAQTEAEKITYGSESGFGIPQIGADAGQIAKVEALAQREGILVKPAGDADLVEYTLVYDLYVKAGQGTYAGLFQTDLGNTSDGDLFLRNSGDGSAGVGISGNYEGEFKFDAWNRLVFTFSVEDGAHVLRKYINGTLVGTQEVTSEAAGSRWTVSKDGFLIFSDENGETQDIHVSSFAFVPAALDAATLKDLGGVDADGPFGAAPVDGSVQLNFDGALDKFDFGTATAGQVTIGQTNGTAFAVKGGVASGGEGGALFEWSNAADNAIVWKNGNWDDIVFETTFHSFDNDVMGVSFRHQENGDQYRVTFDAQSNVRKLVKIVNGTETLLAQDAGGYRFNSDIDLKITVIGDRITVQMDDHLIFGGPVADAAPLGSGTVGLYSSNQMRGYFDDVVVRAPVLSADAGEDQRVVDWDGDGRETVVLDGSGSVLPQTGVNASWSGLPGTSDGVVVETEVYSGLNRFDFALDNGKSSDRVKVDLVSGDRLIAADRFEDGDLAGWKIVDTTELGDGADWAVVDGALVERSGSYSRELTWNGASNADVWKRGWSPLGDGVFALHKGTYALWEGNQSLENYGIETMISAPQTGGVGVMLNWIDDDNYYKLEIDLHAGLTTLVKVVDGYESYIGRVTTVYTPGDSFHLRADNADGLFQVWVDGQSIFHNPIEDHDLGAGAAGVYAWGAAGVRFDDIAIVSLEAAPDAVHPNTGKLITGTAGDDVLSGTAYDDTMKLGAGNDVGIGLGGDDKIFGEEGDDRLQGGEGSNLLDGGEGTDTADYSQSAKGIYVRMDQGWETAVSNKALGWSALVAGIGNGTVVHDELVSIENLIGTGRGDVIAGSLGSNTIRGGAGNDYIGGLGGDDVLLGEEGNDKLIGGAGNDLIDGGAGNDILTGGTGADIFVFTSGNDVIKDFGSVPAARSASSADDMVRISFDGIFSFDDVLEHISQNGPDTVISFSDADSLTLKDVSALTLDGDDFQFV